MSRLVPILESPESHIFLAWRVMENTTGSPGKPPIFSVQTLYQGSCRSWKSLEVMEFKVEIFKVWKTMENE